MATRLINNLGEGGPSNWVVSVYVNECNSFENVLKYQYITDTFVFFGGSVH